MPDIAVVAQLREWTVLTGPSLHSLTLICKASSLVTDGLLADIAPQIPNLKQLHIAGSPKVTKQGILAILNANAAGIETLALEGLSAKFASV